MKKVVVTFGRMNPPTSGHQKLVDKINSVAKANRADARVYLSHSQNNKKDPLDYNTKINLAIKAFGSVVTKSGSKTIIQVMQELQRAGYTDVILVVGSDRVSEFDRLLGKYNGKDYTFDSITVVSAGQRDPDAEDVSGMSASKLRGLAKEGNFAEFKKGLPRNLQSDAKKIYDQLRSIMEEEQLDEYTVLNLQQRMKRARVMKRIARKAARMRKIRANKMADQARLTKRSRKKAIQMLRKRVAGSRGKSYAELGRSEKITVDKLVAKKSAIIDKLAKRLLPKVRKAEVERLRAARSTKNETLTLNSYKQLMEVKQDPDIKDREGAQPAKYHSGLSKSTKEKRDTQFQKGAEKHHSDPSAYPEKHAGDTGVKTKTSKHTKKYHDMFGEMMGPNERRAKYNYQKDKRDTKISHDRRIDAARLRDARLKNRGIRVEEYELTEDSKAALQKKADKSGIPYSILKKVYDRGMAAWRTGHRPGAGQEQWAYARVNSFITKGKGTWGGADSDLAKQVRKEAVGTPMSVGRAAGDQKTYTSVMETIKHEGDKWVIYSKDGSKKLGEYDTETAAKKRLRQIEFFKHQNEEAATPAQQAAIAISMKEKGKKPKTLKEISPIKLIKYASKAATSADAARKAGDMATVAKREKGIARAMDKEVASRTAPKPSAPVTKPQPNMKPTPERRWDGSTVNLSNKGTTVSYEKYVKEDGYKWQDFSDTERAELTRRMDSMGFRQIKNPDTFNARSVDQRKKLADILRKPEKVTDFEPIQRITPAERNVMNNSYIPEEFSKMLEDADRTIDRLRWADVPQLEPLKRMSNDQLKGYVRDYVSKNKDQVSKFMGAADSGMFGRAIIQKMAPNYIPATKSMTDKDWSNAWKAYDNIDPKIKSNIKKGDVSDFQTNSYVKEGAKEIHDQDKKRMKKDILPKSGAGQKGTDELVKNYVKDTPYMSIEKNLQENPIIRGILSKVATSTADDAAAIAKAKAREQAKAAAKRPEVAQAAKDAERRSQAFKASEADRAERAAKNQATKGYQGAYDKLDTYNKKQFNFDKDPQGAIDKVTDLSKNPKVDPDVRPMYKDMAKKMAHDSAVKSSEAGQRMNALKGVAKPEHRGTTAAPSSSPQSQMGVTRKKFREILNNPQHPRHGEATKLKTEETINGYCPDTGELVESLVIEAAEYQGKKVKLNNPFRLPAGSKKKFGVYVKNDKGNVVKVTFGDPNMEIKRDDPERRKAFRSRHSCDDDIGPKWKARYWSCYQWRAGHKVDN